MVLDPVMVATSGDRLIAESAVDALRRHLLPRITLVTPNLPEAAILLGEAVVRTEAEAVAQARRIADVICVQNEYNIAHRQDDALIDSLAEDGIAYVPFFPLGGFTPLQSSTLSEVAASLNATPMQVALAWLLHRSPTILLIPGTSSVTHLHENMAAGDLTLSTEVLATLDSIAQKA